MTKEYTPSVLAYQHRVANGTGKIGADRRRWLNETQQDERRPRTEAVFKGAAPSLLTGRPTYYTDPVLQRACRCIIAAAAALKKGGKP